MTSEESYEIIYDLVTKYIKVDCYYLTSSQNQDVLDYLDTIPLFEEEYNNRDQNKKE